VLKLSVLVVSALLFFVSCESIDTHYTHLGIDLDGQNAVDIPKGYKSYTLFINPSYTYNQSQTTEKINALGHHFKKFSDSIGDNNIAVWCGSRNKDKYTLYISRSKQYADKFKLDYNGSPFVIFTDENPDTIAPGKDSHVIILSFANMDVDRIIYVLNAVERKIRQGESNIKFTYYKHLTISASNNLDSFVKDILLALAGKSTQ
jgi:hypothetical protein